MILGVAVAAAGALGAATRFVIDAEVRTRTGRPTPWGTVAVNISGSLLLGFLVGLVLFQGASTDLKTIAGTGFCGGYTTFSTASFETARLARERRYAAALMSSLGTLALTVAAGGLGLWLAGA